jgi:hypothetical protein
MTSALTRPAGGVIPGLALLLAGCVAPPQAQAPIELTVTVRGAGDCCAAANLIACHDRTADIKAAYADPSRLHHTVPVLGYSQFDLATTVEHDLAITVERDLARTVERDLASTVERDLARTVERDRGDTVAHDLLRCRFRNKQLGQALTLCHQDWNECHADDKGDCAAKYRTCYDAAVAAGPFDTT